MPPSKKNKSRIEKILAESLKKEVQQNKKIKKTRSKMKTKKESKNKKEENVKPKHKFLTNAPDGEQFFLINGDHIKNIFELSEKLDNMDENVFHYHANEEKNDFGNWIEQVFNQKQIAQKIKENKNKKDMQLSLLKEMVKTFKKKG